MRCLLFVQRVESLFGSGITQQAYFTRLTLERCGVEVDVGSVGTPLEAYRAVGIETLPLEAHSNPSRWQLIVFISAGLRYEDPASLAFFQRAKASGVKLVQLLCGNYFHLLQEQFVFKHHARHELDRSLFNPALDEYWALETYTDHRSFLEALLGRPVRIAPYCWNSDVVDAYCRQHALDPAPRPAGAGNGLRIVIAEPNVSIHKSALVPLLIAEGLHRDDSRVLVLSGRALDHELLAPLLRIYREKRVEIYPRMPLMQVLHELRAKGHRVLFISHQISNGLNFLHFEAVKLGYSVVHNSMQLRETGYYYAGEDVAAGIHAAQTALSDDSAQRRSGEGAALAHYDPGSERVIAGYRDLIAP